MLTDEDHQVVSRGPEDIDVWCDIPIDQRTKSDMDTIMEPSDENDDFLDNPVLRFPHINIDVFNIVGAVEIDREVSAETWAIIESLVEQEVAQMENPQ